MSAPQTNPVTQMSPDEYLAFLETKLSECKEQGLETAAALYEGTINGYKMGLADGERKARAAK